MQMHRNDLYSRNFPWVGGQEEGLGGSPLGWSQAVGTQWRQPPWPSLMPPLPSPAIPSAPQAVISSVNETSLMLEWTPPRDSGGREDLVYNIICKSCGSGRGACTRCGDNVQYAPRQLGLTEPRIYISDLLAHTQYTFEIQAVNGVTDQSPFSPQFASVNITTNQAGEHHRWGKGGCHTVPGQALPAPGRDSHIHQSDPFLSKTSYTVYLPGGVSLPSQLELHL
jgi:ephrin-B